jgi:hypothetical protein
MGAIVTGTKFSAIAAFLILYAALRLVAGTLQFIVGILGLPFGI